MRIAKDFSITRGFIVKGVRYHETSVFAQRTVPPPRTLVPCILAALTAGAVTLGALPAAYAAPIVRSTVTEEIVAPEGVAGSIDGSAATITVGTEGGGVMPPVWDGVSDETPVCGSYYSATGSADRAFTLTGGRAIVHSGTMLAVFGGTAGVNLSGSANATAKTIGNSVKITGGAIEIVCGGGATATADAGTARAVARDNIVHLSGGTYGDNIWGGNATANSNTGTSTAVAENNTVYITGGTYDPGATIYAGYADTNSLGNAIARNNTLEIADVQGLELSRLCGGYADGASEISEGNALILRNAKNITTLEVSGFQKAAFYVPADIGASDAMLKINVSSTENTDFRGAALEAHLPLNISANRIALFANPSNLILTDGATTMNVYEGVSGTLPNAMRLESADHELVVNRGGAFRLNEDNAKSLAETMAGAAAFLGTGANLFTDAGLRSASTEAAALLPLPRSAARPCAMRLARMSR